MGVYFRGGDILQDVNGTLAGVAVQDKNRTQTMFVAFAGRNKV